MNNKKAAAVGITGIAIIFLELVVFVAFAPSINEVITQALPYTNDNPIATFLLQAMMLFIVIGLTFGTFKYFSGERQQ